jgi:hypothetical protein
VTVTNVVELRPPSFFAEKGLEASEVILSELKFRIPPNAFHDEGKREIGRILPALNRTLQYGGTPWNQYRVETWLRRRGVSWARSPWKPAKRWSGLLLEATGYGVSSSSLNDHPPDIEGFSQIRDDDTKFNQFPHVPGENTESISKFCENPSISPASEVDMTSFHPRWSRSWTMCRQSSPILHALLWT